MKNPDHTEDSKTDEAVGGSEAGVIRAFDAFMTFEDEEE